MCCNVRIVLELCNNKHNGSAFLIWHNGRKTYSMFLSEKSAHSIFIEVLI